MRPIPSALVELAAEVTRPLAQAHGAPVHVGDPQKIGIADVMVTVRWHHRLSHRRALGNADFENHVVANAAPRPPIPARRA